MHPPEDASVARPRAVSRAPCLGLLCLALSACAGGGSPAPGPPAAAPTPASVAAPTPSVAPAPPEDVGGPLPPVRGFDGGTTLVGFTGQPSSIQDTIVRESPNRIWGVLPAVFSTLGVPTRTLEPGAYTIGLEMGRVARIEGGRLSTHLECGRGILGPNADNYDVTMTLIVQLAPHASGGTSIRTTLDAYARPRTSSGEPLHCASSRTLERRVMELMQMELSGISTRPVLAMRGRTPVTGDRLRVECLSPAGPLRQVTEGVFLGNSGENLLLALGSPGAQVSVPAANVGSVQVRERRSRTKLGGIVGALAAGIAGGFVGDGWYEPDNFDDNVHYRREVFIGLGAVAGLIGGYLVGSATGSFIKTDAWVDAPSDWTLRYMGLGLSGASSPESPGCPSP